MPKEPLNADDIMLLCRTGAIIKYTDTSTPLEVALPSRITKSDQKAVIKVMDKMMSLITSHSDRNSTPDLSPFFSGDTDKGFFH